MPKHEDTKPYIDFDIVLKAAEEPLEPSKPRYFRITLERGDGEVCSLSEAATALLAAGNELARQAREEDVILA